MKYVLALSLLFCQSFSFAKVTRRAPASVTDTSAPANYVNIYLVPNIDKVPRYIQDTRDGERDSNVCFAAAAAQAIDLHRYNNRNIRGSRFIPSSPILLASRVHHIRGSRDGQGGSPPSRVIEHSFRFGNCSTLAPVSSYNDGILRVEEELFAITNARNVAGRNFESHRQIANGLFEANHADFFNRTYQLCQPGSGAAYRDDENFGSFAIENNGAPVTDEQWTTALNHAQNQSQSGMGFQAIAITGCAEVLDGTSDGECSNHAMTILGKRCPNTAAATNISTGGCQVLVRDSYLHEPSTLPSGAEFYNGIVNDRNDIWVSELAVKNVTRLLHMIGTAPAGVTSAQRIGYGERARQNRENDQREPVESQPDTADSKGDE